MQRRLVLALSIACAVLLVTSIGLGIATLRLWQERAGSPVSGPTPSPTAEESPQTVHGIELTTASDYTFGPFAMTNIVDDRFTILYATIENDDPDQAVAVYFDITAYGADGRIIDRGPSSQYLLPGQVSLFRGVFSADLSDAVLITVEQTMLDVEAPVMTGGVTLDSISGGDGGYVEGTLTSTLSAVPEYPELYFAAFVDDKLYAVCSDIPDIPANGTFTARCVLEPADAKDAPEDFVEFPEDAVFEAYLSLEIPY